MKVILKKTECLVYREPGDISFHGVRNAAGESRLLYHVKRELNLEGYDFVKKRMWKDGHMVSEMQQYLRQRKPNHLGVQLAIYNGHWDINGIEEEFNAGVASLEVVDIGLTVGVTGGAK